MRRSLPRVLTSQVICAACAIAALAIIGCADAPHGPYAFRDYGDLRVGGDFIERVPYRPGTVDARLRPPTLLYPEDRMVFGHYPRELVFRWEPAVGTPADAEFLFEMDYVCGGGDEFGDWARQPDPFLASRTRKTTLNTRFVGAQPGRWRIKVLGQSGESEWSAWRYFRFTR